MCGVEHCHHFESIAEYSDVVHRCAFLMQTVVPNLRAQLGKKKLQ